jgi:hypothetical protein
VATPEESLAAIVDGGRGSEEADALLAAIVDGGVYVPVDDQGSVMFLGVDDSGPVLPGYVDDTGCGRWLPAAASAVRCDALRLLDIAEHTGVARLAVFGTERWVTLPIGLIVRTLRDRGIHTRGEQTVNLRRSTHPVAVALRGAVAARVLSFPAVRTVWIAHARFVESGHEQVMVHMAVDPPEPAAAKALLDAIVGTDVTLGPDDPSVALRVLLPHEADTITAIDRMGLDTVRADHAAARVTVVSQEFDKRR